MSSPTNEFTPQLDERRRLPLPYILVPFLAFLFHLALIVRYSVDVPFMDEWDCFPREPYLNWLWAQHNEHRIVTTKLVVLLSYTINGWDIRLHQLANFFLYGSFVFALAFVLWKEFELPSLYYSLIALWLLSPMAYENHLWAFQTQFHLVPICLFAAAYCLFLQRGLKAVLVATVLLCLAILSMASGIPGASVLALSFLFFDSKRGENPPLYRFIPLMGVGVLSVAYLVDLQRPGGSPPLTWPWTLGFLAHFVTMLTGGLGLNVPFPISLLTGTFILGLVAFPWIAGRKKIPHPSSSNQLWALGSLYACWTIIFVAISMGRASIGWEQGFAIRYKEWTSLMMPLTICAYGLLLKDCPIVKAWASRTLIFLCACGWLLSLHRFKYYPREHQARLLALSKIKTAHAAGEGVAAPAVRPGEISPETLKKAWDLGLSFTRK